MITSKLALKLTRPNRLRRALDFCEANDQIARYIVSGSPAFVGRMGRTESQICWFDEYRLPFLPRRFRPKHHLRASQNAGVTPSDDRSLLQFTSIYRSAICYADLVGMWDVPGMPQLLETYGWKDLLGTELGNLDPLKGHLRGQKNWVGSLAGKNVLVVHPFTTSIQRQYARRDQVSVIRDVVPEFNLDVLAPPVTFAGETTECGWVENLSRLKTEVARRQFDVALIACGAYGFPLGAFVKQTGRVAIHLGGALQLLFGIWGSRWDDYPELVALRDDSWVRPEESERPRDATLVEGACYW